MTPRAHPTQLLRVASAIAIASTASLASTTSLAIITSLACQPRSTAQQTASATPLHAGASATPTPPGPPAEAWLRSATQAFETNRARRDERADFTFARVRFELPALSPAFWERHCSSPSDCKQRTRYVALRQNADQLEIKPDCSALDEEHLLDELTALAPWKIQKGELRAGTRLQLLGKSGKRLIAHLEFLEAPRPTPADIWDEWLYARSITTAFAASQGFQVPLLGKDACATPNNTSVCEAELATEGNPLALLDPTPNCAANIPREHCLRRHLLAPVDIGYFQNFCGRVQAHATAPGANERQRATQLTKAGLDLARLLTGSVWTAYAHRVPQTDMLALARMITALDLTNTLRPRFTALAARTDLPWRNRLRARFLAESLAQSPAAPLDDAARLRAFRELVPRCPTDAKPGPCTPKPSDDQLDRICIDHTLGFANFACAHG
ncbi:MAG: hypothetical protein ACOY0T_41050 [Myxococcota bacterium]